MLIIGEKINSSIKSVAAAIESRNSQMIRSLALKQAAAGALYLEVNAGGVRDEIQNLCWLVTEAQSACGLPLCIDSTNPAALEAALEIHQGKAIINSVDGQRRNLEQILPLARRYGARLVALCMDEMGISISGERRLNILANILQAAGEIGLPSEDIYVDPLVLPVSINYQVGIVFLETLTAIRTIYPQVKTICGLSNISYGLPLRKVVNRAFGVLVVEQGIDALIMDPTDSVLLSQLLAAEAITGQDNYCRRFIRAYRSGAFNEAPPPKTVPGGVLER